MIDQQRIDEQERIYREKTINFLNTIFYDSIFTSLSISSPIDLLYSGYYKGYLYEYKIEIKQRCCKLSDYPNALLTIDKYDNLISYYPTLIPLYIVFYDDALVVFNLGEHSSSDYFIKELSVPYISYSDSYYCKKRFYLIPISYGYKYPLKY